MNDKKISRLIEKHKETKNIFRKAENSMSLPVKSQMTRFVRFNIESGKEILPGFSRFKPEDLR